MEAIINARNLKEQVGALQGILARKESIPILGTIKLAAEENGLMIMSATDLDVSLVIERETDILQSGSICLSGKKLGALTGSLPDEPVHLKLLEKGDRLEFRAGRFKSRLAGIDSGSFPEIPRSSATEFIELNSEDLLEGLRRTIFAVPENEKRFVLSGILLEVDQGRLQMVSTDGHRLCHFQGQLPDRRGDLRCLIPLKAARELRNMLTAERRVNPHVRVQISRGQQLEFAMPNVRMSARELSGTFPNWERVKPAAFSKTAQTSAAELQTALQRVAIMADESHRRIDFTFFRDRLILRAETTETGNSVEEIRCEYISEPTEKCDGQGTGGESFKTAFNGKFLTDFLALTPSKTKDAVVVWNFNSPETPSVLNFQGEESSYSYLLVPLATDKK